MANAITSTGLQTDSYSDLLTFYTSAFQTIYGADVNLDPDTPDGQLIEILIQANLDTLDLIRQVYNMMDPDNAIGVVLDFRVAINGIQRQAGTYTITPVTVVAENAFSLFGIDQSAQPAFTVADNAGNQWLLVTSTDIPGSGAYVLNFRAAQPGKVLTVPNTITVPVSIVLGVNSINNPTTYLTLGVNEESDAALKIRRQKSVSLASQGYYAGLLAALENIPGVTYANIEENDTGSTDGDGTPSHSIWVIVAGSGAAADIANAIYTKRNAGCGMRGNISATIIRPNGTPFNVFWDDVVAENLFIKFTVTSLNGVDAPNIAAILSQLPVLFTPGVFEQVNINDLATLVQQIDPNTLVTNAGFSTTSGGAYTPVLTPTTKVMQFIVSSADIIITPMQMSPSSAVVPHSTGTATFKGLGGFGTLVYSMASAPSGGTINSSTGVYTAGSTGGVTDVVRVTDSLSNTATANVAVT